MLPLSSLAARRLGTSYTCAACRNVAYSQVATRRPRPSGWGLDSAARNDSFRTFSASPWVKGPAEKDAEPGAKDQTETPNPDQPKEGRPRKKRKREKEREKEKDKEKEKEKEKADPTETPADKPSKKCADASKKDGSKPAKTNKSERDLKVLQGALAALKNVLNAQNINIDDITKPKRSAKAGAGKQSTKTDAQPELPAEALNRLAKTLVRPSSKDPLGRRVLPDAEGKLPFGGTLSPEQMREMREKMLPVRPPLRAPRGPKRTKEEASPKSPKFSGKKSAPTKRPPAHQRRAAQAQPAPQPWPHKKKKEIKIECLDSNELHLDPIDRPQPPVPPVSYGLDRVLFNPGVYHLQDPRSRVFNFDPYLSRIMPIREFDFNALKQYITSSKDTTLINIARENKKRYTGSTSSMTSMLAHFHYLLSAWREINTELLTQGFNIPGSRQYTQIMRAPSAIFLHWKDGVYAIDADKEFDTANILSMLGKSMEKLLTLDRESYERYRVEHSDQITEEERNADESYHYTGLKDFMMRSQLDAHDPRLPGTGMYDLKTRAVISIRMDAQGFQKGLGYEIRNRFGEWESFEREYFDMIRSAFLKYSLQVRMGRMDGIFVAFHNTERIFGFQYIPLSEMDTSLHGTSNTTLGDKEFKLSLGLLNDIFNRASEKFPERSLRLHFETRPSTTGTPFMYIFAKPVAPGDIQAVQEAGKARIEEFERQVLGLNKAEGSEIKDAPGPDTAAESAESDESGKGVSKGTDAADDSSPDIATWEEVQSMVEDAMEDDALGVGAVRDAIEDALEMSGLLQKHSSEDTRVYVDGLLKVMTGQEDVSPEESERNFQGVITDPDHVEQTTANESETDALEADTDAAEPDTEAESGIAEQSTGTPGSSSAAPVETDGVLHESVQRTEVHVTETSQGDKITTATVESVEIANAGIASSEAVGEEEATEDGVEGAEDGGVENDVEGADKSKATTSTATLASLRDLILRMAQNMDGKRMVEREVDDEDDLRLQKFERILGQLIAGSREGQHADSNATSTAADGDGQTSAQGNASTGAGEETEARQSIEEAADAAEAKDEELLGMVLTIRNRVNGSYVARPEHLDASDKWDVEYNLEELSDAQARNLYAPLVNRRKKILETDAESKDKGWQWLFEGNLKKTTAEGREFRKRENQLAKTRPVYVVGEEHGKAYEDVFGHDEVESEKSNESDTEPPSS